jgi:hypothetical protein
VFENEHALPRAFIVHRIKVIDPCHGQEALTGMKSENFQPAKIAFIEGHIPASLVEALERVPEATGSWAEIKEYRDNRVCIQATMDYPGFLILSDIYYPGWKVIVDGKEGKIYPADYLLRGVFLERGAHTIKFVYSPASFKIGASVGVLVLLSLLAIPFFRKRNARLARG